ncbi:MAG: protein kinase domain-containing protein [Planctomycetota bacterium]
MSGFEKTEIQSEDDRERSRQLSLQGNQPPAGIEGYSFVRRLGTGAYGTVWLAREDRTGRMVAIKFYPHRRGLNWSMLSREVEKLAAVYTSRNIVRLLDVGWNADPPYFVMEFVENGSLGSYLARGRLPVSECIRIIREVCSALIDAHGAGVLHCDLKPDNILLDQQLNARICDFGQARMSHDHSPSLGTLYYMAPEQADLEALPDARWDVYAVGALLYHMLTGAPPHRSEQTQRVLESAESLDTRLQAYQQIISSADIPGGLRQIKGVDSRLAAIIERCLAVNPADRFPNAQAIRDALDARDRQRARRPLLLLGLVGQIVLIAAMIPIFVSTLIKNREAAEFEITERALESDALSARLQAAALEDELSDRLEELQQILSSSEVAKELEQALRRNSDELVTEMLYHAEAAFSGRPKWIQLLDTAWSRANTANAQNQRGLDTSWFLTDASGIQIWRRDFSDRTLGDNFAYRDYFHGLGKDLSRDADRSRIRPLEKPHVSVAYKSTTTDRQTVALSVPVRDSAGNVIGIFARTAHLGDLQGRLGRRMSTADKDDVERKIALAEVRSEREISLLDHPVLTDTFVRSAETSDSGDELFDALRMDSEIVDEIMQKRSEKGEVRLNRYRDPVGHLQDRAAEPYRELWLAAMAPVENTGWLVIVQERRNEALEPVDRMWDQATRQSAIAVFVAIAMMAIVWFFVWRALMHTGVSAPNVSRA